MLPLGVTGVGFLGIPRVVGQLVVSADKDVQRARKIVLFHSFQSRVRPVWDLTCSAKMLKEYMI